MLHYQETIIVSLLLSFEGKTLRPRIVVHFSVHRVLCHRHQEQGDRPPRRHATAFRTADRHGLAQPTTLKISTWRFWCSWAGSSRTTL